MTTVYRNNASGKLSSPAAAADTVLYTTDDSSFPPGSLATLEYQDAIEIVRVLDNASGLTVVRGYEGTVAQDWPVGALIEGRITAGMLRELAADAILTDGQNVLVDQDGNVITLDPF